MDPTSDTVFEVDPVTHIPIDTAHDPANAHKAMLSTFIIYVPDDYAPEIFLAHTNHVDSSLMPEQGPNLISDVGYHGRCHVYYIAVSRDWSLLDVSVQRLRPTRHRIALIVHRPRSFRSNGSH